jgi:Uma2 family endonuclease
MQKTDIMTADELFEMEKDEYRYELIQGRLKRMAPTGGGHSRIEAGLIARLWLHARTNEYGDVYSSDAGFVFAHNPDTVLSPDAAFLRHDRVPSPEEHERFLTVVPDLAVEIISPSDRMPQVREKAEYYIEAGVRLVWVVNPRNRTVTVYSPDSPPHMLNQDDELDGGDVLPDFHLTVSEIFE